MTKSEIAELVKVPDWFVVEMNKQLEKNADKGGWIDSNFDFLEQSALENLRSARNNSLNAKRTIKQYVDAANFCMMMADIIKHDEKEANE